MAFESYVVVFLEGGAEGGGGGVRCNKQSAGFMNQHRFDSNVTDY